MKNPCDECLVRPICNVSCTNVYKYYKRKFNRLMLIKRSIPITGGMTTFLLYVFAVSSMIENRPLDVIYFISIVSFVCSLFIWIENKFVSPKLKAAKYLLEVAELLPQHPRE